MYATRSDHGIELMNDAMCRARREFIKDQFPQEGLLFDVTPVAELADLPKLCDLLMKLVPRGRTFNRRDLRLQAMQQDFCHYSTSDYTNAVAQLLKSRRLFSKSGRTRINDDEQLSSTPFH